MDYLTEKIAGSGPARKHNLAKCRKELEKSCSNYERRLSKNLPPTPRATPSDDASKRQQNASKKSHKATNSQSYRPLNEQGQHSRLIRPSSIEYVEKEIRQRSQKLETGLHESVKSRHYQPPVSIYDVFDGYVGSDFANDFCVDELNNERSVVVYRAYFRTQRKVTTRNSTFKPIVDEVRLKRVAARIARRCRVRDKEPFMPSLSQEALHRLRTAMWQARAKATGLDSDDSPSSPDTDNENGVHITQDGCIIQRGFDVSPPNSNPTDNIRMRVDSCFQTQYHPATNKTMAQNVSKSPFTPETPMIGASRNAKGRTIPLLFRKQKILNLRKVSALSTLISCSVSTKKSINTQQFVQKNQYQSYISQQRHRMPVPARPVVFFTGSPSSGAIASDSDDESHDERQADDNSDWSSVTTCAATYPNGDDEEDSGSNGSVATVVPAVKPAEIVKTSKRPLQLSAIISPPPSKIPVPSCRAKQGKTFQAGTPRPQQLSKSPKHTPLQQTHAFPPRPQRTSKVPKSAEQQQPRAAPDLPPQQTNNARVQPRDSRFLSPRAQIPCQRLGLRLPTLPDFYQKKQNHVSALLAKTDSARGVRPPNFRWDHIAPMHGFSISTPFFVLD